jgi:hypothetical protein
MPWAAIAGGVVSALASSRGQSSRQRGSSQQNQTRTGTASQEELLRSLSPEDMDMLRAVMPILAESANSLTRAQAIQDVAGFTDTAIRALKEQGIPQLFAAQIQSGAYGQTMTGLLGNDLVARTSESIARNTSEAVTRYATAQSDVLRSLFAGADVLKGAETTRSSSASSRERVSGTGETSAFGSSSGVNALLAGLGAGLSEYGRQFGNAPADKTDSVEGG